MLTGFGDDKKAPVIPTPAGPLNERFAVQLPLEFEVTVTMRIKHLSVPIVYRKQ